MLFDILEELMTRTQDKEIELIIDPLLHAHLSRGYRNNSPIKFRFNLFDFILDIGLSRSVRITKKVKFADTAEFLERFIKNDNDELRVAIDENDVDDKINIAEHIGAGLSVIIAEKLYDLERSNISRIKRRGRSKPDFEGYNKNNLKVVWESKGSTNNIGQDIIQHAKKQKRKVRANVAFASFATLKSDSITSVRIEDPTPLPLNGNNLDRMLAKVRHYTNLFNFIGQAELSRYFKLIGKRLKKDTQFPEFYEKINLYDKIKENYIKIAINGNTYLGNIERIEESNFLFTGLDEKLISVDTFIDFMDYENGYTFSEGKNTFRITRDGICYGYLLDLGFIKDQINIDEIAYYRDNISIFDFDDMYEFQLVNNISYLFEKEGFIVQKEFLINKDRCDLLVKKDNKIFVVEIKKKVSIKSFEQIKKYKYIPKAEIFLLLTTSKITDDDINYSKSQNIIIIDRNGLKDIIRNKKKIMDFIK